MHRRLQTALVLFAIFIAALLVRWPNLHQPVNRDISAYATIGARMHEGDWPYRDLFDHKQPLIYGVMWVLQGIAPRSNVAIQLAAAIIPALGGMAMFLLLKPRAGLLAAGASALLFVTLSAARIFEGTDLNTEHVLAAVACLAVLWPLRLRSRASLTEAAFIGVLGAVATMTKAVAVFSLPALLLALLWPAWSNRRLMAAQLMAFAGGLLIPWLVIVFLYWIGGGIGELFAANIFYNLAYVESLKRQWVFFGAPINSLLVVGAVVLAIRLIRLRGRDPVGWTILLWLAGTAAGAKIGRGDFPHYFAPMVPALTAAACLPLGIGNSIARHALNAVRAAALVAISIPLLQDIAAGYRLTPAEHGARMFGGQSIPWNYQEEVGAWLRARARPADTLFVAGAEPGFYWQSSMRPATRYLYDYPARLEPARNDELMRALTAKPPRYVVLADENNRAELPWMRGQYDLVTTTSPVQVFELRQPAASP